MKKNAVPLIAVLAASAAILGILGLDESVRISELESVQMAGVLRPGGLLVLNSRNWELVRDEGSGLRISEQLVERGGRRALVVYGWSLGDSWADRHHLDIAVAIVEPAGNVSSHAERLAFSPFRHEDLDADIRSAGLVTTHSTYAPTVDFYLITAKRPMPS